MKKVFLEILQNSQENTCATVSFLNKVAGFILQLFKKKDPTHVTWHVFSCKFCEFSRNTFSYRTPPMAASEQCHIKINDPSHNCTKVVSIKDTFLWIFSKFSKQIIHRYTRQKKTAYPLCSSCFFILKIPHEKWRPRTSAYKSLTYSASPHTYIKLCLPL